MISYFIFTRFSKLIDLANLRIYSVLGKIRRNKVLKIKKVRFKNEFKARVVGQKEGWSWVKVRSES
tara:strand:- start:71260 stop:71457 length:198 start_codon:yes stop_codon:yes gene_type:complete